MADKELRLAKPGTLLSQWWTLGALLKDKRRAASHDAVMWVILDAHRRGTGKSPASVRFIEAKLGGSIASYTTILKAIRDLEEWGYITSLPRRQRSDPTEFVPVWVTSIAGVTENCNTDAGVTADCNTSDMGGCNAGVTADCNDSYLSPAKGREDKDIMISSPSGAGGAVAAAPAGKVPAGFAEWTTAGASFKFDDDDDFTLTVNLRSRGGKTFRRRLSGREYRSLQDAAMAANPAADDPSDDAREFKGVAIYMSRQPVDGHYQFLPANQPT